MEIKISDLWRNFIFNFEQYDGNDVYNISFVYSSDFINLHYSKAW